MRLIQKCIKAQKEVRTLREVNTIAEMNLTNISGDESVAFQEIATSYSTDPKMPQDAERRTPKRWLCRSDKFNYT
jgi:hypothetical protein